MATILAVRAPEMLSELDTLAGGVTTALGISGRLPEFRDVLSLSSLDRVPENLNLTVRSERPITDELWSSIRMLVGLSGLKSNWDSYGSKPIAALSIISALKAIVAAWETGLPAPNVFPTPKGGVQLDWNLASLGLEIEALPNGYFSLLLESERLEEPVETDCGYLELLGILDRAAGLIHEYGQAHRGIVA
jgi:hypothetical protein